MAVLLLPSLPLRAQGVYPQMVRPQPVAPVPPVSTVIASSTTYQIAFPAGASQFSGGCLTATAGNAATLYVDPTGAGGTVLSGGQTPLAPGATMCWPALSTAITVFGNKGDSFSGSAA